MSRNEFYKICICSVILGVQEPRSYKGFTRADPGFFLGGGALVSCSTSTPINHIVFFFFAEYQLY